MGEVGVSDTTKRLDNIQMYPVQNWLIPYTGVPKIFKESALRPILSQSRDVGLPCVIVVPFPSDILKMDFFARTKKKERKNYKFIGPPPTIYFWALSKQKLLKKKNIDSYITFFLHGNGDTIRIVHEIQCLPYAEFF